MTTGTIIKIKTNRHKPLYGSLLTLCYGKFSVQKSADFHSEKNEVVYKGNVLTNDFQIARLVAASSKNSSELLGKNFIEQTQVESFLNVIEEVSNGSLSIDEFSSLTKPNIEKSGFVVLGRLTLADLLLWAVIEHNEKLKADPLYHKLFDSIKKDSQFADAHNSIGKYLVEVKSNGAPKVKRDEGKFIELPNAEPGKVVVRFPPEASGYLHIGHAKAALLNQYYQQTYKGQLIMRFDDTNPAKENADFEKVILEDLELLGIKPDRWTHSSDLFDLMLDYAEKLLKDGKAYVDDTDTETMRKEREERVESKNRNNSAAQNLELWEEMKKGTERGQQCCVRLKIDMKHNNGALRDPTIYRCKPEPHVRTGEKYKVYPTYDFACPIVDSVEGVTHALRTTEYTDRDEQYSFICDALGIRRPDIWAYARLNMTHTVMSKRKLTKIVDDGIVDGWDDPRLPTVRGVLRLGLTIEGLKQFILAQGGSRSVVTMEWDKIWAFNKKVIDPIAPRYTALDTAKPLARVHIEDQDKTEQRSANLHPKDASIGQKQVWYGPNLLIEQEDAQLINANDTVTFINFGNLKIVDVQKQDGVVTQIKAKLDLDNKDFKKTLKVTWLADVEKDKNINVKAHYYEHVISKPILDKNDDWMNFINRESLKVESFIGEPVLKDLKKSDIVQIQRKSFFICDRPYDGTDIVLIAIPDGAKKEAAPNKAASPVKETNNDEASQISSAIEKQGLLVRDLKAKDPKSAESKDAIAKLLELKKQYKAVTGAEWKPSANPPQTVSKPSASNADSLSDEIAAQGILVRDLKAKDAKSQETKDAIAKLLDLKKQYKTVTGAEWKPSANPPQPKPSASNANSLSDEIAAQGNLVRDLKAKDAKSQETKDAIAKLLDLKKQYKAATGAEYKPPANSPQAAQKPTESSADLLSSQIAEQGTLVRDLKAKDAKSQETKDAIVKLLDLKKQYKTVTGADWKPPTNPPQAAQKPTESSADSLSSQIAEQGNLVRTLKAKDAKSQESKEAIAKLLDLKKQYKTVTGADWKP